MNYNLPSGTRLWLLAGLAAVAAVGVFSLAPIPQDPAYHDFADQRAFLGVPNFFDVLSNLPFAFVGTMGLAFVVRYGIPRPQGPFTVSWERWAFGVLFAGVGLTAFGSGYYHLAPDTARLFWDRLPMTIGFMALFAITISERVNLAAGRFLLPLLLMAGFGTVVYWRWTESQGAGDLRPYVLVQFFPLLAIPAMLLLFPSRYTRTADFFGVIGWYGLAKVFEVLDRQIFGLGGLVSGHTLKHLASGIAAYWILRMVRARRTVPLKAETGSPWR